MVQQDNSTKYLSLREKYPCFSFDSYHYAFGPGSMVFGFEFRLSDDIIFHPVSEIPWKDKFFRKVEELSPAEHEMISSLVFHIGMAELASYWKACCAPLVSVPFMHLSGDQAEFWKKLYFNGLEEFFHVNSISADMDSFMRIEGGPGEGTRARAVELQAPPLVPIGGGKDSAVTIGLMQQAKLDWIPFAINPIQATKDVILAAGKNMEDTMIVQRKIDPLLLRLNDEGYLNGHTPFSAIVAFYSLLVAYLSGSRDIILSNESSANEATIPGTSVNHQYSKTYEFEKDFRLYTHKHISPSFNYFSLLRPLTELQIGALFAGYPEYFPVFRSCNAGSKTGTWCGHCPKCLFTWIILSPFISQKKLTEIFGKDLLEDPGLKDTLDELCGISAIKPFECIGTVDEVNLALNHLLQNYPGKELPYLLRYYSSAIPSGDFSRDAFDAAMGARDAANFVPKEFLEIINKPKNAR
jgi:UDP-N-acetyl-alpha-D-muramoyl-L-alanyl-L-glutamate epimerase